MTPMTMTMTTQFLEEVSMPTDYGRFRMLAFGSDHSVRYPHVAFVHPEMDPSDSVVVRIHSECMTGDLFTSHRCDCGPQMDKSMEIVAEKKGIFIYLRQEGRGIGLINKMKAYNLQDQGRDTLEANVELGFEADARRYEDAIAVLDHLEVRRIKLLTNNPEKIDGITQSGIIVEERLPLIIKAIEENASYLETKKIKFRHLL